MRLLRLGLGLLVRGRIVLLLALVSGGARWDGVYHVCFATSCM